MKTHPLVSSAIEALENTDTSPAIQKIAVDAVIAAVQEGIVPSASTAVGLVWAWMKRNPECRVWAMGVGDIPNDAVRADAIEALRRTDGGTDFVDVALDVLSGRGHAAHIDDALLLELVERYPRDEHVRNVCGLVSAVHRARGLTRPLLLAIRDRWAASESHVAREQAVSLMSELPEVDLAFVEKMLADPSADVRVAMAQQLDASLEGVRLTLPPVEARLRVETHPSARAALLRAQAEIEDETPRRRRRP
jgi:hypothetical protein